MTISPTSSITWKFHPISLLPILRIDGRCHVHAPHRADFYRTLIVREEGDLVDSNLFRSLGIFLFEQRKQQRENQMMV